MHFIHKYEGFGKCKSRCKVYMVFIDGITHFCFEELDDNTGTSVTNMSEYLATQMVKKFCLEPYNCKFYETYPHNDISYKNLKNNKRSFDEINYLWELNMVDKMYWMAAHPHWKSSDKREIFDFII